MAAKKRCEQPQMYGWLTIKITSVSSQWDAVLQGDSNVLVTDLKGTVVCFTHIGGTPKPFARSCFSVKIKSKGEDTKSEDFDSDGGCLMYNEDILKGMHPDVKADLEKALKQSVREFLEQHHVPSILKVLSNRPLFNPETIEKVDV